MLAEILDPRLLHKLVAAAGAGTAAAGTAGAGKAAAEAGSGDLFKAIIEGNVSAVKAILMANPQKVSTVTLLTGGWIQVSGVSPDTSKSNNSLIVFSLRCLIFSEFG